MNNFEYYNPVRIIFGKDRFEEIDRLIPKDARVLVTYGGGSVKKYGTLDKVISELGNRTYIEFGGIEPNPKYETLMKAVEVIKENDINYLLAVGGGSVIDGTKFINLAANYEGEQHADLLKRDWEKTPIHQVFPLGTVLTLPATGSEMNAGAVISYKDGKFSVVHPLAFPTFSILNPTLTMTLPKKQVANGVVDTFVHVIEQYLTFPVDARFQDCTAEGILQTLVEIGRDTMDYPENYEHRANLMWCATMALNSLIGKGVPQDWSTHMIGHELTALFGIDHAQSLAVVLPSLMEVRREEKREKILQYGERIWGITGDDDEQKIDEAIAKTKDFFESLDVKTCLSAYDIPREGIDKVIHNLEKHHMTNLSERGDQTLEISRIILEKAY